MEASQWVFFVIYLFFRMLQMHIPSHILHLNFVYMDEIQNYLLFEVAVNIFLRSFSLLWEFTFSFCSSPPFVCFLICSWSWNAFNRMLDILEKFLIRKGYCFSRLDGSTPTNLRQSLVDDFNSSPSKQVNIQTRNWGRNLWFNFLLGLISCFRCFLYQPELVDLDSILSVQTA